jgi:phosphohistidine phosphatase
MGEMILYFLRHGLAENRIEWKDDDSLRPLTDKGVENMNREADVIASLGLSLNIILTSPLKRAFQTAEIIARRLHKMDHLMQDERLAPGFNLEQLSKILSEVPEVDSILLVGHEPDFSETVSSLIGGGNIQFKKGGLTRVDLISSAPVQGELVWLIPPKILIRSS